MRRRVNKSRKVEKKIPRVLGATKEGAVKMAPGAFFFFKMELSLRQGCEGNRDVTPLLFF